MALRLGGTKLPKELEELKTRELTYFYQAMITQEAISRETSSFAEYDIAYAISNAFEQNPASEQLVAPIISLIKSQLLPMEHFSWLSKEDPRALIWTIEAIHEHNKSFSSTEPENENEIERNAPKAKLNISQLWQIPSTKRKESIIAAFDYTHMPFSQKSSMINTLEYKWRLERTPESDTSWISKRSEKQAHWMRGYLEKKGLTFPHLIPTSADEVSLFTLVSLDLLPLKHQQHPALRTLLISKMKNTWIQHKYRTSGKAKKQHNFRMEEQSRQKLKHLASARGLTESETLEALINNAYTNTAES